jgi:hypothetical protein
MTNIFTFLAGLLLCPEFLGGAAAPPCRRREDSYHACHFFQQIELRLDGVSPYH